MNVLRVNSGRPPTPRFLPTMQNGSIGKAEMELPFYIFWKVLSDHPLNVADCCWVCYSQCLPAKVSDDVSIWDHIMILLLGSPRSGTTWLGKLFDSHPNTLYLHEPDSVLVNRKIPFQVQVDETDHYLGQASDYLESYAFGGRSRILMTSALFNNQLSKYLSWDSVFAGERTVVMGYHLSFGYSFLILKWRPSNRRPPIVIFR